MNKHLINLLIIGFLIFISIPLILPFIRHLYFPTHDGEWAVVRAVEMFREVRDLQLPPRFSGALNFGYGYPLFNFAYPFPYYLSLFLHTIGFTFINSIKFLFALSVPLSAIFMYLAAKKIWKGSFAGVISAVLYIYVPYRMVDLYVRGSLGESISFVLYPLILFFLVIFIENKKLYAGVLSGLLFAILILTHNIMAVYFLFMLGLFFIAKLLTGDKRILKPLIFFAIIGALGSCYFWLPALIEKQYILLSIVPIADRNLYFPTLTQLLIPSWGYGGPTSAGGFSYQFGIPASILLIIFALVNMFKIIKKQPQSKIFIFIIGTLLIFFFLLFPSSKIIWENSPLLNEINYPWTLLGPIIFLISLAAGSLVNEKITRYIVLLITLSSIIIVLPYAHPEKYIDKTDDFYISNDATTTSSNELMPLWVKIHPINMHEKIVVLDSDAKITSKDFRSNKFSFNIDSPVSNHVTINRIYYPGWEIKINGLSTPIDYDNNQGVMQIDIQKGASQVVGVLKETPLRMASNIITLFLFLLIALILTKRKFFEKIIFT